MLLSHDEHSDNNRRGHPNLLGEVVVNCHVAFVKLLTTRAVDVNVDYTELRPLESASRDAEFELTFPRLAIAAVQGNVKLVQLLCEQGANIEVVTDMDKTALFFAAEQGCLSVVKYLVETRNADVNCAKSPSFSFLAVEVARDHRHDEVIHYLREHGPSRPRKVIMEYDVYEDIAEKGQEESELTCKQRREMEYCDHKQALEQLLQGRKW